MVHHTHQHVLVLTHPEKLCLQRDLGGQVERMTRRLLDSLAQTPADHPVASTICQPKSARSAVLPPGGIRLVRESGAKRFVTGDDIFEGHAQRVGIKVPAQSQRGRHVVHR